MVPVKTNSNWLPSIFNDFFENEWPVSYTHLDVYKRQELYHPSVLGDTSTYPLHLDEAVPLHALFG